MFEAQVIADPGDGTSVYSPWFPRQGDVALFTLEIGAVSSVTLTVEVATKNTEDPGDGTLVGGSISRGTVGRSATTWGPTDLEELVRFKFTAVGDGVGDWVLFRMLPAVWFDSLKV